MHLHALLLLDSIARRLPKCFALLHLRHRNVDSFSSGSREVSKLYFTIIFKCGESYL